MPNAILGDIELPIKLFTSILGEFSILGDLKIKKNAPITVLGDIEYSLKSLCPYYGILL